MKKFLIVFTLLFFPTQFFSQEYLNSGLISNELREKANSVVRYQKIDITIISQKSYRKSVKKIITVLNEYGLKNIDAREYYSNSEKVNSIEAIIYDSFGQEIKKIKRKDFIDQSVADGFSILSDNRVLYLDYTPTKYPFTIVYESETQSINTAFLPTWYAIDDYYESVQKSEFKITYPSDLGFKYKELNFEGYNVLKREENNSLSFSVENLEAQKREDYAPDFKEIVPNVMFGLEKFSLEGVEGFGKSWDEFGKVYYDKLINTDKELNPETIKTITRLTEGINDPIEKAKIIYKYVQSKTRYVSIQLGIGGWKPMLANDVDRLGYGDCKALSNYTRVLLDNVGVNSYYTVIYGDVNKRDLDKDFVSYQGNHVILTIPHQNKNYFLECTSQTSPFGFGGDFTDDRYALMIKPEGGLIVKTNGFNAIDSYQKTKGSYIINEEGNLNATAQIYSGGIQYDNRVFLSRVKDEKELHKSYKNKFNWIGNLNIKSLEINDNRDKIEFLENISFSASNYCNKAGNSIYFTINVFNKNENIPDKYRNRKNDFVIKRGYHDLDEIEITIPQTFEIEFLPEKVVLETEFGSYSIDIKKLEDGSLVYTRSLIIKEGNFSKDKYESYRDFREKIAKNDNLKIVLIEK